MSARATESYGQHGVTWVDRFGVWLSQRAIRRWLPAGDRLKVIELGCGYRATQLVALRDRMEMGTGVDFSIAPELRARPGLMFHEGPIEATLPQLADGAYDVVLLISVLEHLRVELIRAMQLCGCTKISDITGDLLAAN